MYQFILLATVLLAQSAGVAPPWLIILIGQTIPIAISHLRFYLAQRKIHPELPFDAADFCLELAIALLIGAGQIVGISAVTASPTPLILPATGPA